MLKIKLTLFIILTIFLSCQKSSIDSGTLKTVWKIDLNEVDIIKNSAGIIKSMSYYKDNVYAVAGSRIIALNKDDGTIKWVDDLFNKKNNLNNNLKISLIKDTVMYLFGQNGSLCKLNNKTGALIYGQANKKSFVVGEKGDNQIVRWPEITFLNANDKLGVLGFPASGIRLQRFNLLNDSIIGDQTFNLKLLLSQNRKTAFKELSENVLVNAANIKSKGYISGKNAKDVQKEIKNMSSKLYLTCINKSNAKIIWKKKFDNIGVYGFSADEKNSEVLVLKNDLENTAELININNGKKLNDFKFHEFPIDLQNLSSNNSQFFLYDKQVAYFSKDNNKLSLITQNLKDGKVIKKQLLSNNIQANDFEYIKQIDESVYFVFKNDVGYSINKYSFNNSDVTSYKDSVKISKFTKLEKYDNKILIAYNITKDGKYGSFESPVISLIELSK